MSYRKVWVCRQCRESNPYWSTLEELTIGLLLGGRCGVCGAANDPMGEDKLGLVCFREPMPIERMPDSSPKREKVERELDEELDKKFPKEGEGDER
jgi:hypothetical protein